MLEDAEAFMNMSGDLQGMVNTLNFKNPGSRPYMGINEFKQLAKENQEDFDEAAFDEKYKGISLLKFDGGASRPLPIDINNPKELFKLYLSVSGLGDQASNYFISNFDTSNSNEGGSTSKYNK